MDFPPTDRDLVDPGGAEAAYRLAAIVESSDDAIVGKALSGLVTSWNKSAERIFGYAAAEMIGESILRIIPPHLHDEEREILHKISCGQRIQHYETVRLRKDGSPVEVSLTVSPVRDRAGRIIGASKIARDITARREAERRIRESEARFRLMADHAPVLVWIADVARSATWFNRPWLEYTGRAMAEVLGHGWAESVHPEDVDRRAATFDAAFAERRPFSVEYRLRRHDGVYRWVLDHGVPLLDGAGGFAGYIGSCVDIDDRKRAEEDRAAILDAERIARAEAERSNRMKDEFLATVSHELRTPLQAVLGWSRLLLGGRIGPEETREALETIERNAAQQAQLIEDLLDMSRIMSGKLHLQVAPLDLRDVIISAIATVTPAAQARGVELVTRLPEPASDTGRRRVLGDATRLQQVAWNLLNNAVKFTPRGGRVETSLDADDDGDHVRLAVVDTGVGIDPAFLPHVFDRFRQADGSTTRRHGGLGLGLSIVRHLVEMHGGSVQAASLGLGQGATFTVILPLMPAAGAWGAGAGGAAELGDGLHAGAMGDAAQQDAAEAASAAASHQLDGVRLLVVDDQPDALTLVARILGDSGAEVRTAASAAEAIAVLRDHRPDLLVSDIGMPDVDGYALLRQVRSLPAEDGGDTPAIALTAFARAEDRRRALLGGFQTHLAKPIDPVELVAAVANLVAPRRRSRAQ